MKYEEKIKAMLEYLEIRVLPAFSGKAEKELRGMIWEVHDAMKSRSKPTPGPYKVETHLPERIRVIAGNGTCIVVFRELSYDGGRAEAEANARAWVDGIAAIEKLERIRDICWNHNEPASRLAEIVELLRSESRPLLGPCCYCSAACAIWIGPRWQCGGTCVGKISTTKQAPPDARTSGIG